ncbi:MAG: Unknown protein [uncultured Sulfurovum sp.]|uniref:Uncharacterized protein n=1 Tax=uncultured Sulfurovum sp. TaxID=269237 RepID=A0A6S6U5H6_9BACT|nr:MAG: Unknown protein [uncultured Sulfurovum sp.]
MTITLNIHNEQLFDKILWFLNRFQNDGLEIITHNKDSNQKDEKEPLENKFSQFSGMWENREITQESIREQAWK